MGKFGSNKGLPSTAAGAPDWLGVAGDFGSCKVTGLPSGVSAHAVNYLFGPRVTYRSYGSLTPFAHVLFGGQHFGGTGGGTANSFARRWEAALPATPRGFRKLDSVSEEAACNNPSRQRECPAISLALRN